LEKQAHRPPAAVHAPPPTSGDHGRAKAADTFALRKYGRRRKEIDDFIARHYRSRGPTWIARQLNMKVTTVIMRARRLGL